MRKLINRPEDFVKETMEGIIYAYGDEVRLLDGNERVPLTNYPVRQGKVGIVTTGGSGRLPIFLEYMGQGMLDGCAVGNVFASPSIKKMADVIKARDHGSGVLCPYGNYGGDNMNFDMACEMVRMDDVETRTVRVKDDVASNPKEIEEKCRDVAGMVYGLKVAGVAAEWITSLNEVAVVAKKALDNTRTMGVALSPCIVPQVGEPTFKIGDGEIGIGTGIHGEKGVEVRKMMTMDEVVKTLVDRITRDMSPTRGNEVSVLVNDLGATPMEEQLIVCCCVRELLTKKGVKTIMSHISEYTTSMEVVGPSVAIFRLDEQLEELLAAPAKTPFYTNLSK